MPNRAPKCSCIEVRKPAQKMTRLDDVTVIPWDVTVTQLSKSNAILDTGKPTLKELGTQIGLDGLVKKLMKTDTLVVNSDPELLHEVIRE